MHSKQLSDILDHPPNGGVSHLVVEHPPQQKHVSWLRVVLPRGGGGTGGNTGNRPLHLVVSLVAALVPEGENDTETLLFHLITGRCSIYRMCVRGECPG